VAGKRSDKWLDEFGDPEELLHPVDNSLHSERKLWCSVVESAVKDALGGPCEYDERGNERQMRILSARAWIHYDGEEVGSFRWIVETLGLIRSARDIRRKVLGAHPRVLPVQGTTDDSIQPDPGT